MPICRNCGKEVDKSVGYKVGKGSYYCSYSCYDQKMSKREYLKKKYEPKKDTDRRDFTDYVQKIYLDNGYDKSEINWTLIMSNAKNILDSHKEWTYCTLQYILGYMYEVLELNLFSEESNTVLSLVPFYGLEAEKYYNDTQEIEEKIDAFEINTEVVTIKKKSDHKSKKFKPIDLTNL